MDTCKNRGEIGQNNNEIKKGSKHDFESHPTAKKISRFRSSRFGHLCNQERDMWLKTK